VSAGLVLLTAIVLFLPAVLVRLGLRAEATSAYPVDSVIDVGPDLYEGSTYTLIVFARSTCDVCQKVRPLIADLVTATGRSTEFGRRLVAVAGLAPDELRFAESLGFDHSEIVDRGEKQLRVRTVPTIVVVSRDGRVLFSTDRADRPEQFQEGAALLRRLVREQAR
jgi:hypothetical protein